MILFKKLQNSQSNLFATNNIVIAYRNNQYENNKMSSEDR